MNESKKKTSIFLDIGGVLLMNGWGHESRNQAVEKFNLGIPEMESRHGIAFETYELGKIILDQYLDTTVIYIHRSFSKGGFRQFMFSQTQPLPKAWE